MAKKWMEKTPELTSKIEEWWKEMWTWISEVISWACNTLTKTLGAWVNLVWAWVSKIQESFCDENNKELKKSRQTITKARLENAKNKGKKALHSAKKTLWGWFKTVKWTTKVAVHSVRKTIKDASADTEKPTK